MDNLTKDKEMNDEELAIYVKSVRNINKKECPECQSTKKETKPICIGDKFVLLALKCKECNLKYSGIKIPKQFYNKMFSGPMLKENYINEAESIELIQYLREHYRLESDVIKQAYYKDWEKRLMNNADPDQFAKIILNWNQVCSQCLSIIPKLIEYNKKEKIQNIQYIIYSYKCGNCDTKLGNIRISKNSLEEINQYINKTVK